MEKTKEKGTLPLMKFIVLAILTLFLIPWTRSGNKIRAVDKGGNEKVVKGKKSSILVIPVLFWIGIAIYEYFWLLMIEQILFLLIILLQ